MVNRDELVSYINQVLNVDGVADYCPNGLQVEGKRQIAKLVTGVTASQLFLESAIDAGADAVLVHHGYFWRGESPVLRGMKLRRIKTLLDSNVSLLAYHLPIDIHPELGNNAQLARLLDVSITERLEVGGVSGLFFHGTLAAPESATNFVELISAALGRSALAVGPMERSIQRVGLCSGGAQQYVSKAAELGLDAFISGEISEQTTHEARENGLVYIAAGHHATERYGVQAVGEHLVNQFDLLHEFIDIDNPA